jgi:hypothetical protein
VTDPVEKIIADALDEAGIAYMRGRATGELDFYLVASGVWIECKRAHSPRIADQMARYPHVIAVQSIEAAQLLARWVNRDEDARAAERRACAAIAEQFPAHTHGNLATAPALAAEQAAEEIAAAIRARGTP